MRKACALILAAILMACSGGSPNYQVTRLPSGKNIKVLGMGKIFFTEGEPALMLKYETEISPDDEEALQKEINEIWQTFMINVEKAQLEGAIISANTPPSGGFISTNRSFNFVFKKTNDGTWVQQ